MNNRPFQMTIYLDGGNTGNLVLKAQGQHYKISALQELLRLAAEREQFIRSVIAGATPHCPIELANACGQQYKLELEYKGLVYLKLGLQTADGGKALLFDWEGSFVEFKEGCKLF